LLDYIPANTLMVIDDWHVLTNNLGGLSDRLTHQLEEGIQKGRLLDLGFQYHLTDVEALAQLKAKFPQRLLLETLPFDATAEVSEQAAMPVHHLDIQGAESFKANMKMACEAFSNLRRNGYQVFITTDHPQRVLDVCKEWDVPALYWADDAVV